MTTKKDFNYDAIVIGIGHAGTEAALALARLGKRTLALSVTLDNAGYLACNPSIGGTAKGHLVREIDALGGEMGKAADHSMTQLRMLNASKGPAVHSLRAQVDKYKYHRYIKTALENTPNLTLRQGEAKELITESGRVRGVKTTTNLEYYAEAVVIASGVYLDSTIIIGDLVEKKGPVSFCRANYLANALESVGFGLRRFKTGTPARVRRSSIDLGALELQPGENTPYSFSVLSGDNVQKKQTVCYLGYTNEQTHDVIRKNLHLSPKYSGLTHGTGARYCPSVEDKIVRFPGRDRHQFFLEPEGEGTEEMYVQGISTGLPALAQLELYRSIKGFENIEIMRDAYAIEYECIDPLELYSTLESKRLKGLYFAGQINGTSGYEEAAAQGLVAGINASLSIDKKEPLILSRENSYIGVLIDDLVTLGTSEPYRMMTSRAEYRLLLRQDNADLRLTPDAIRVGLATKEREQLYNRKRDDAAAARELMKTKLPLDRIKEYFEAIGEPPPKSGMSAGEIVKRGAVDADNFSRFFDTFNGLLYEAVYGEFIEAKYEGYLERERRAAKEAERLSEMLIPASTDYTAIEGLRNEAKEKLSALKPLTIGQASRISGVTPADVNVLIIKLKRL